MQIAGFIGPSLAGFIINYFTIVGALTFDSFSFVISFIALAFVRVKEDNKTTKKEENKSIKPHKEEKRQSLWNFLCLTRYVLVLFFIFACVNLVWTGLMEVALSTYIIKVLKLNVKDNGFIITASSIGALVGAFFSSYMSKNKNRVLIALVLGILQGILIVLIPILGDIYWGILLAHLVLFGICNGLANVVLITRVQQGIPIYLMGKVMSVMQFAMLSMVPLSGILAGFICKVFGPELMFFLSGFGLIASFSLGIVVPSVYKVSDLD